MKTLFLSIFILVCTIGYSQKEKDSSSVQKVVFPPILSINLKTSPIISLHLYKQPRYNLFSTCNTCFGRIEDSPFTTQNYVPIIKNSPMGDYYINTNPYGIIDSREVLITGAINLVLNLLQANK